MSSVFPLSDGVKVKSTEIKFDQLLMLEIKSFFGGKLHCLVASTFTVWEVSVLFSGGLGKRCIMAGNGLILLNTTNKLSDA